MFCSSCIDLHDDGDVALDDYINTSIDEVSVQHQQQYQEVFLSSLTTGISSQCIHQPQQQHSMNSDDIQHIFNRGSSITKTLEYSYIEEALYLKIHSRHCTPGKVVPMAHF